MTAPSASMMTLSPAAFSALCHWIIQVGGLPHAEKALIGRRGCSPEEAAQLRDDCERLHAAFQTQANAPRPTDGHLEETYRALKLRTLTEWERWEEDIQEGINSGRYAQAREAPEPLEFKELFLLVLHGGIELARPLLLRAAREDGTTLEALWAQWIATDTLDLEWARRRAGPVTRMKDMVYWVDTELPLFFLEGEAARARQALEFATKKKERALSDKPVRSLPRLLSQLLAFWEGDFPRDVLVKSFGLWFGVSDEEHSPVTMLDKLAPAYLYGRFLEPLPAYVLVERIKTHLPMFSPKQSRTRASKVSQVRPVVEALEAVMHQLARGEGLSVLGAQGDKTLQLGPWSAQPEPDEDFF